ncbi:hypothetical protein [Paenibacillus phocaensis]|nr:hypothetical protein [Paenibacillus phocaensis]
MKSPIWERVIYALIVLLLVMMIVEKAYDMYRIYEADQMLQQMKERLP